jgi:hypothetical protein
MHRRARSMGLNKIQKNGWRMATIENAQRVVNQGEKQILADAPMSFSVLGRSSPFLIPF